MEINLQLYPTKDTRYGGTNDHDNSGVMKYVSIRHAGAKLNVNGGGVRGLSLYGVGDRTIIEYIDI